MGKNKIKFQKPKKRQTWKISPVTRIKGSDKVYKRKGKHKFDPKKEMECETEVSRGNFRFCPRCSVELAEKRIDHRKRKACPACSFVFYRNPVPAAGVILTENEKILLVKRKYDPFKGDWSLPAGFMEYEESPEECAVREIKEELNLDIKINKLFNVYSGSDDPRTNAVLIVYLGEIIGGKLKPGDDAEEAKYFGKDQTPPNIAFQAHRKLIKDYFDSIKVKT